MELKNQIMNGVISYARNEVYPKVTDEHFKFIISAALAALEVNPALADPFFTNEIVKSAMTDLSTLEKIITKTLEETGGYTLTVPAIKFLLPDDQMLRFTSDDARTLFKYIRSAG